MTEKRVFFLNHQEARIRALACVAEAPEGHIVTVKPNGRSLSQNDKFHAQCGELADSGFIYAGKRRNQAEWKVILVSAHAVATKREVEIVTGLEGEVVNLRESTADMSSNRSSSLIEYTEAFIAECGIRTKEW